MVVYLNLTYQKWWGLFDFQGYNSKFATCEFHQARRQLPYDLDKAVYLEVQSNEEGPEERVVGYPIGSMGISIFTYT